jgi:hypothetical protein
MFPTCWHHNLRPPAKAMEPICLFLFRGDAARHRRATVKSGRRTTIGPLQSSSKIRQPALSTNTCSRGMLRTCSWWAAAHSRRTPRTARPRRSARWPVGRPMGSRITFATWAPWCERRRRRAAVARGFLPGGLSDVGTHRRARSANHDPPAFETIHDSCRPCPARSSAHTDRCCGMRRPVSSGDDDFDASGCTVIFSLWVAHGSVWSDQERGVKPWHRVVKSC